MSISRLTVFVCAIAVTIFALPFAAAAQSERGTITGVIMDLTKAAVPGVSVRVINTATNAAANVISSGSGSYSAANLPPGTYHIEATLQGFQISKVEGIILNAGTTARIDVVLNLGSVTESVNVVADNATIQTEDAKIATNVSNRLIDELPLVVGGAMRSPFDLISTVPEARGSGNSISLGGGQGAAYGATLDGVSVNTNRNAQAGETAFLTPSLEAITEFTVETNGFKPEFGQAGGGIITFASKSGTNELQGSAYGFFRDAALDAKRFFETTKGIYKQSDYGGSFGGPVTIPNVYNGRNKTFFFASYEGFYNEQGSNAAFRSVPTPEMFNGDFSNWVDRNGRLLQIYDPATTRPNPNGTGFIRDPFPNNQIPLDRFSATAQQYLGLARGVLAPNRPGLVPGTFAYVNNNYVSEGRSTVEKTNKFSIKLDQTLNNAHRLSYVFNRTKNSVVPGPNGATGLPEPFADFQQRSFDGDLHRATWDWVGATAVNHLTVGANTFLKNAFNGNVDQNWQDRVCIRNAVDCNQNMGIISFSEFSQWGGSSYNGTEQPRFTVKNDVTLIKGSHTIKTGFTYDRQQANGFGQQDLGGRAGFDFKQTGRPGVTSFTSGSSFASFLLGYAHSGRTETIRYLQQIYPYYGFYAQDDWRVNSNLVFNYGLRYEFTASPRAGGDQYSEFSPTKPNPAANNHPGALLFAGEGPGREGKRSLIPAYYGAVAPRISAAYTPNERTTFRGGVGRSFGRVTVIAGSGHFAGFIGQYPFSNADNGVTPTFLLDEGLPSYPLPPRIDPSFSNNSNVDYWNGVEAARPAVYDTWTLSVQREVRRGMTVEVDYNGSRGSHLNANLLNTNQIPLSTVNDLISRFGVSQTIALLQSNISSTRAADAGITPPYANFTDPKVQNSRSVAQALRPFPQYQTINTTASGGDKTGRSTYHAGIVKVTQRMTDGLMFQGSYTLSKLMTNADSFNGSTGSMDTAQPDLEWAIGRLDQTHSIKLNTVVELPFGEGRRWLTSGLASKIIGGWRIAAVQNYTSGTPLGVTTNAPLPIFNGTNRPNVTGADWRAPIAGDDFDPNVDRFFNRAAFVQPVGELGNAPRLNSSVRNFWNLTENISVAKTITVSSQLRLDVRMEAFNLFNRVVWSSPNTNFNNNNFGRITGQSNTPRQMQVGIKLYW